MPTTPLPTPTGPPLPGSGEEQLLPGPGQASRLARALPGLVRWPNLAIMLLSLGLVRNMLLPGQPLYTVLLAPRFGLLVLAALLVAAAGYIINDYYDVKIDAINRPDRLVVGRLLRRRHAMLAHVLLSGLG
ncbi:MAG: prenyltransferase, partial [Hymenobacter sp.]